MPLLPASSEGQMLGGFEKREFLDLGRLQLPRLFVGHCVLRSGFALSQPLCEIEDGSGILEDGIQIEAY